jgi:MFS family permease
MMTSLCNHYWQYFLAQGVVMGAGLSLMYHPSPLSLIDRFNTAILCINTWFLKRRGLAMGITVSGSSFGGVCFPIMLKRLFDSVGFGWGVRAAAFLILGCMIVANILVRSRLPPPGWTKGRQIVDFSAFKEPVYCCVVVFSPRHIDADISSHPHSFTGDYSSHLRF